MSVAAETDVDIVGTNVENQNYGAKYPYYASPVYSYLATASDGTLMRVQAKPNDSRVVVQFLDSYFKVTSVKTIQMDYPVFGAFYASGDNYYILSGKNNTAENDEAVSFNLTRYDKYWNEKNNIQIIKCNTTIPFNAGSARIDEVGNYLVVRTCHEMYGTADGKHHQANCTMCFEKDSLNLTDYYFWPNNINQRGYVSHSFNQFVRTDGGKVYCVDHGDANPRALTLLGFKGDATDGKFVDSETNNTKIFSAPGNSGDNYTGYSVGGFEISSTAFLIAGNKVDFNKFSSSKTFNVFLSVTQKGSNGTLGSTTVKQITSYPEGSESASTPQLVDLQNGRFLLMWSRGGKVYYVGLDGNGRTATDIYSVTGALSDCAPIMYGSHVLWYTYKDNETTFYRINTSTLAASTIICSAKIDGGTSSGGKSGGNKVEPGQSSSGGSSSGGSSSSGGPSASDPVTNPVTRITDNDNTVRIYGVNRARTALSVAAALKQSYGVSKFGHIVVAYSENYADALAGSYLACKIHAPILIVDSIGSGTAATESVTLVKNYIKSNLTSDGTVTILGGTKAVSSSFESSIKSMGFKTQRLYGNTRFTTNISILNTAGVSTGANIIVCDGYNFADAVSVSSTGYPVLLLDTKNDKLCSEQISWLKKVKPSNIYIVGGPNAVSQKLEEELYDYGKKFGRIYGDSRYATSIKVANSFFTSSKCVFLAWGENYPDALCAGPLAYQMNAPIVLVSEGTAAAVPEQVTFVKKGARIIAVGGPGSTLKKQLTDKAIHAIKNDTISVFVGA